MCAFKFWICFMVNFWLDPFQSWIEEMTMVYCSYVHNWAHFMAHWIRTKMNQKTLALHPLTFNEFSFIISLHFQTHKYLGSLTPFPECCVLSFHYCQHCLQLIFVGFVYYCSCYRHFWENKDDAHWGFTWVFEFVFYDITFLFWYYILIM